MSLPAAVPATAPAAERPVSTGTRGAPGRVAEVHAQTRRGLAVAGAFVVAAVAAAVSGVGAGWWLPLHLFVVGALLSAVSAVTQMLAVTWSASPAPSAAVAAAQRGLLAVGAVVMVTGRETQRTPMFVAGGVAVVIAMLGLAAILVRVRRTAVTPRFAPAIEAYVAAVVAGAVGMSIGIVLGAGRGGVRTFDLRNAHLALNVFGLIGLVVAGTLPFFAATQVRARMAPRATPAAIRVVLGGLAAAVVAAAVGHVAATPNVAAAGLIAYALGLAGVAVLLPVYARSRLTWAGPRVLQLLAGLAWWIAMTIALAVSTVRQTSDRTALQALVIGGLAQILIASLAYLVPVLRGGGHQRLTAGFAATRSWLSFVAGNAAGLAAFTGAHRLLAVTLIVWLADTTVRALRVLLGSPTS